MPNDFVSIIKPQNEARGDRNEPEVVVEGEIAGDSCASCAGHGAVSPCCAASDRGEGELDPADPVAG